MSLSAIKNFCKTFYLSLSLFYLVTGIALGFANTAQAADDSSKPQPLAVSTHSIQGSLRVVGGSFLNSTLRTDANISYLYGFSNSWQGVLSFEQSLAQKYFSFTEFSAGMRNTKSRNFYIWWIGLGGVGALAAAAVMLPFWFWIQPNSSYLEVKIGASHIKINDSSSINRHSYESPLPESINTRLYQLEIGMLNSKKPFGFAFVGELHGTDTRATDFFHAQSYQGCKLTYSF